MYRLITAVCLLISIMGCSTGSSVAGSGYSMKGDSTVIAESLVSGLQVKLVRMSGTETTCSSGNSDHIELNGPIGPDSTYIVAKYLKMTQPCS